jgi:hypothetical protein
MSRARPDAEGRVGDVAFEADHFRRLELTARGYIATGLTWDQLVATPEWAASRLRALLAQTPGPRTCS